MKKFLGENFYFFFSSVIYPFPSVQLKLYCLSLSHTHHNLIHKGRTQMALSQGPPAVYQRKKISRKNSSISILLPSADPLQSHMNGLCWSPSSDVPGFVSFFRLISKWQTFGLGWALGKYPHKWHRENSFHERNLSVVLTFPLQSHISWIFSLFQP